MTSPNPFAGWSTDLLVERLRQIARGETSPANDRPALFAAADRLDAMYYATDCEHHVHSRRSPSPEGTRCVCGHGEGLHYRAHKKGCASWIVLEGGGEIVCPCTEYRPAPSSGAPTPSVCDLSLDGQHHPDVEHCRDCSLPIPAPSVIPEATTAEAEHARREIDPNGIERSNYRRCGGCDRGVYDEMAPSPYTGGMMTLIRNQYDHMLHSCANATGVGEPASSASPEATTAVCTDRHCPDSETIHVHAPRVEGSITIAPSSPEAKPLSEQTRKELVAWAKEYAESHSVDLRRQAEVLLGYEATVTDLRSRLADKELLLAERESRLRFMDAELPALRSTTERLRQREEAVRLAHVYPFDGRWVAREHGTFRTLDEALDAIGLGPAGGQNNG